ncbi:MAG: hypothetical protein HY924_03820 [Elusimicrobia bacterium]|nr:hypothetical protein [Elusimicrobiota bacterium]
MKKAALMIPASAMALLLSLAAPVRAEAPAPDFDQGVDASDILQKAKAIASEDKKAGAQGPVAQYFTRYDRDCASFTFRPEDNPASTEVLLRSTEWVEECYPAPQPPYPPYPPQQPYPRPGYPRLLDGRTPHSSSGQNCYERPGRTYQERASVAIRDRQALYPWEYDSFQVCLEGPWLRLDDLETAYEYKTVQGGNYDGRYVVSPIKKIRMKPDPAGITARSLGSDMTLSLADRWASHYAGEQTVLILKLKKHVPNWFDALLVEKELSFPSAGSYIVDLKAFAGEFSQKLEAGKKYYVDYSFKRVGKISKDSVMKVGETDKAVYQPSPSALGR